MKRQKFLCIYIYILKYIHSNSYIYIYNWNTYVYLRKLNDLSQQSKGFLSIFHKLIFCFHQNLKFVATACSKTYAFLPQAPSTRSWATRLAWGRWCGATRCPGRTRRPRLSWGSTWRAPFRSLSLRRPGVLVIGFCEV